MAARKPAPAPQKQKLRKNHGPKRKLFHEWTSTMRLHFAKAGVLDKYSNYDSFVLSCGARGIRSDTADLWEEFIRLPDKQAKDQYLKDLKDNAMRVSKAKAKKSAK
jgi:hypothetical protein